MFRLLRCMLKSLMSIAQTHQALAIENLALRQQLAVLHHSVKRPRLSMTDRAFWVFVSRWWPSWRTALILVKPQTVVAWHRKGFRLFWAYKSRRRRGRPSVNAEIRALVRQMAQANVGWGAPRVHGELLKLGFQVSQATVSRYMPKRRRPPSQTWRTFLDNHMGCLASIDFFVVPTATFGLLFAFLVLRHERRRVVHFNATAHPTARWTAQQIIEAFPEDSAPRYMVRDRDGVYGAEFITRVHGMGIDEVLTAPRSPWQNPFVGRDQAMLVRGERRVDDATLKLGVAVQRVRIPPSQSGARQAGSQPCSFVGNDVVDA